MRSILITLSGLLLVWSSSCTRQNASTVRVATAANVQYAMSEIREAYLAKTGVRIDPIIGSSGKLTAQILNGAPYDVFVSADLKYPRTLVEAGRTTEGPRTYASGALVAWTLRDDIQLTPDLRVFLQPSVKKIAIANPELAPYGAAALQLLTRLELQDSVQHKLVYGESISQTSQYVSSRAADVGLTAKAVVLSDAVSAEGTWIDLNPDLYTPIEQSAVLITPDQGEPSWEARRFYDFLFSATARSIFRKYGYLLPE